MTEIEILRAQFRPEAITTLFVGESAPVNGSFFYKADSQFYRYTRDALNGGPNFLAEFKGMGFYLDDLVLDPCNHLTQAQRVQLHAEWVPSLAARLRTYRPRAVVSMMKGIASSVQDAILHSGLHTIKHYAVSFPGNGQQAKFKNELGAILAELPGWKSGPPA